MKSLFHTPFLCFLLRFLIPILTACIKFILFVKGSFPFFLLISHLYLEIILVFKLVLTINF